MIYDMRYNTRRGLLSEGGPVKGLSSTGSLSVPLHYQHSATREIAQTATHVVSVEEMAISCDVCRHASDQFG